MPTARNFRCVRHRGASLVEFGAVLPLLFLVVLGIIEFGWFARTQLAIANATREGARIASIGKTSTEIKTRIINAAKPITITDTDVTLQQSTNNGASYVAFPADNMAKSPAQNGVAAGALIRVTVNTTYRRLLNLPVTPSRINVQVSMVRER